MFPQVRREKPESSTASARPSSRRTSVKGWKLCMLPVARQEPVRVRGPDPFFLRTTASTYRSLALSPGSRNPDVSTSGGLPVRRHPNRTWAWSPHPRSRCPFIAAAIPVVVALYPDVVRTRTDAGHTSLRSRRRGCGWHCNHNWRRGSHRGSNNGSRRWDHHDFSAPATSK